MQSLQSALPAAFPAMEGYHQAQQGRVNQQPPLVEEELMTQVGGEARMGTSNSLRALEDATLEELASALTTQLTKDKERAKSQMHQLKEAERQLEEKQQQLDELEKRIFAMTDGLDDVIELNVGGQHMSTTRGVLCCAQGSMLAGMFSGNFDSSHKRDKDGRIFLDVDPPLFEKVLRHLRLRRIASPEQPAPLPHVPEDLRAEWDMMIKYFGLDLYMYGMSASCNIFQRIAEMVEVDQAKLQENDIVRITLSSTGGVPSSSHQEVLGSIGFSERSLENSYGAYPNSITIKFLKHRVKVEAMELRAKIADVLAHMSNKWTFKHGTESINMSYSFSRSEPSTGRLDTPGLGQAFVDEVVWLFPRDFCLEHIVLWGHVIDKT
ncbi:unnamed protein product [Durusdinium trenchii]|uniref:Potassium channel tetramerisation-type BTB domain-containing protein n=2 Tax=Durusdinium trenchii TaxID=1381693 RepID=A0ABP0K746_9DINO